LDLLLDPKHELTHKQICDELSGFILAGHETTARTIAIVLAMLVMNPDKYRLAMKEIDEVIVGNPDEKTLVRIKCKSEFGIGSRRKQTKLCLI